MKKTMILAMMALVATTTVNAQSAADLAEQQKKLNEINMKLLNAKPSKQAKKQARALKKEGWLVMGSGKAIENQLTSDQLLAEELMADETGNPTKRFIQHSATSVGGTYNAAYAAARAACQVEIATNLETQIAAAMQDKIDNAQTSAINATTVDKFHERVKAIVNASLTRSVPGLNIYRVLTNNNYEVMVTLSFDKQELAAQMKRKMQKELEIEGDELDGLVNDVLSNQQ